MNTLTALARDLRPYLDTWVTARAERVVSSTSSSGKQLNPNKIWRLWTTGFAEYDNSEDGLTAALDDAASYDKIYLPATDLNDDFTVPANVTIIGAGAASRINGTLTNAGIVYFITVIGAVVNTGTFAYGTIRFGNATGLTQSAGLTLYTFLIGTVSDVGLGADITGGALAYSTVSGGTARAPQDGVIIQGNSVVMAFCDISAYSAAVESKGGVDINPVFLYFNNFTTASYAALLHSANYTEAYACRFSTTGAGYDLVVDNTGLSLNGCEYSNPDFNAAYSFLSGDRIGGGGNGTINRLLKWENIYTAKSSGIADNVTAGKVLTLTATNNYTITFPATGTVPIGGGSGVAARLTSWSDANTLQSSKIADGVTAGKVLTLAAADNYTLTAPGTGTAVIGNSSIPDGDAEYGNALAIWLDANTVRGSKIYEICEGDGRVGLGAVDNDIALMAAVSGTIVVGYTATPGKLTYFSSYSEITEVARFSPTDSGDTLSVNTGTAPTTGDADTWKLYSKDENAAAGKACLHLRTEGGVVAWLGEGMRAAKCWATPEGGWAVQLVAGENLAVGDVVYVKITSGADGKVWKNPVDGDMPIGVCYAAVSANANVWVVVSGIASVLPESGITAARGNVIYSSNSEAGRVDQSGTIPVSTADHWREIGHFLDTGSGNGVATRAIIHFN